MAALDVFEAAHIQSLETDIAILEAEVFSRLEGSPVRLSYWASTGFNTESRIMIDNPTQLAALLSKLEAALPLPARITPGLVAIYRRQYPDITLPRDCQVTWISNAGDEGGIVCKLTVERGSDDSAVYFTSITHLGFDRRHPLAREISVYQKHRIKKLRKQRH